MLQNDTFINNELHIIYNMETKEKQGEFIYYQGKYWLVHKNDADLYEGAYFASPIYQVEEGFEVRHGGSNWCYKIKGVLEKDPEHNIIKASFESQIKHLKWAIHMMRHAKREEWYNKQLMEYEEEISFYESKLRND